ncbi:unnamed protein product [Hermetia illucens]|uniref:Uncharacterized protein n=1 Tax=Hermetia illucens TaxID=343691 RepID=A0A7R8YUW0_HERIL|nr:proline-rich protein 36-like [Hermetia illucens]CAD7083189.1 unnamed protein product [Hermetia illucens]
MGGFLLCLLVAYAAAAPSGPYPPSIPLGTPAPPVPHQVYGLPSVQASTEIFSEVTENPDTTFIPSAGHELPATEAIISGEHSSAIISPSSPSSGSLPLLPLGPLGGYLPLPLAPFVQQPLPLNISSVPFLATGQISGFQTLLHTSSLPTVQSVPVSSGHVFSGEVLASTPLLHTSSLAVLPSVSSLPGVIQVSGLESPISVGSPVPTTLLQGSSLLTVPSLNPVPEIIPEVPVSLSSSISTPLINTPSIPFVRPISGVSEILPISESQSPGTEKLPLSEGVTIETSNESSSSVDIVAPHSEYGLPVQDKPLVIPPAPALPELPVLPDLPILPSLPIVPEVPVLPASSELPSTEAPLITSPHSEYGVPELHSTTFAPPSGPYPPRSEIISHYGEPIQVPVALLSK